MCDLSLLICFASSVNSLVLFPDLSINLPNGYNQLSSVSVFVLGIPEQGENNARATVINHVHRATAGRLSPRIQPRGEWKNRGASSLTLCRRNF